MQLQRTRDTSPELAVRRIIHAAGLRYKVDASPLPGMRRRADLVFRQAKVAVFIDGCFWHGCPIHGSRSTKANPEYWSSKVAGNRARDHDTDARLVQAEWLSLRAWEHEPPAKVAQRVIDTVLCRRTSLP